MGNVAPAAGPGPHDSHDHDTRRDDLTPPMPSSPRISVIVPTYRRTTYLRDALRSALGQTLPDIEVFVSDNSDDDVVERVVRELDDPRLRYRRNETNIGGAQNFLRAVADAGCDVVACLHDDDVWEPAFLERVGLPLLDDPGLVLACCDWRLIDETGATRARDTDEVARRCRRHLGPGVLDLTRPDALAAVLVDGVVQPAYNSVFRRSLVVGRTMPAAIDPLYDLWIRELLCRDGATVRWVGETLTSYRVHAGSQTASAPFLAQTATAYEGYAADPAYGAIRDELQAFLGRTRWHLAGDALTRRDYDAFSRELRAARGAVSGPRRVAIGALASLGPLRPVLRPLHEYRRLRAARRP